MVPTRWQKMCVNKGLTVQRVYTAPLFLLLDCSKATEDREQVIFK